MATNGKKLLNPWETGSRCAHLGPKMISRIASLPLLEKAFEE